MNQTKLHFRRICFSLLTVGLFASLAEAIDDKPQSDVEDTLTLIFEASETCRIFERIRKGRTEIWALDGEIDIKEITKLTETMDRVDALFAADTEEGTLRYPAPIKVRLYRVKEEKESDKLLHGAAWFEQFKVERSFSVPFDENLFALFAHEYGHVWFDVNLGPHYTAADGKPMGEDRFNAFIATNASIYLLEEKRDCAEKADDHELYEPLREQVDEAWTSRRAGENPRPTDKNHPLIEGLNEVYADLVAVTALNDPAAVENWLLSMPIKKSGPNREHKRLRNFGITVERAMELYESLDSNQRSTSYMFMTPLRQQLWQEFFKGKSADEQAKAVRTVLHVITDNTRKILAMHEMGTPYNVDTLPLEELRQLVLTGVRDRIGDD